MANKAMVLLLLCAVATGCQNNLYWDRMVPAGKSRIRTNPMGAHTVLLTRDQSHLTGELLTITDDSLVLLTTGQLLQISNTEVAEFTVALSRPNKRTYGIVTVATVAPSLLGMAIHPEWAGGFLTIILLNGLYGLAAMGVESLRDPHYVTYPSQESNIYFFRKFARFPAGIPADLPLRRDVFDSTVQNGQ